MMELAMLWGLLSAQRNPLSLVEIKGGSTRPRRKKVIITAEQFQLICNGLEEPFRTMVLIAMCLGLRVSEILALKWADFDFEDGTLMITRGTVHGRIGRVKTEYSEDEMHLDPAFAEILLAWQTQCPASEGAGCFRTPTPAVSGILLCSTGMFSFTVQKSDGDQVTYDPSRLRGISAYREIEREFAVGDRLQFTAPNREIGVANRDLGTIEQLCNDGQLAVRMNNGKAVSFDANRMRHFDHGYAVTSHSSQGLTAERVLVNIDTNVHPELLNTRFAYVSLSRASHDAQIYANDAGSLVPGLSHDASKTSALEMGQAPSLSYGIGIGM